MEFRVLEQGLNLMSLTWEMDMNWLYIKWQVSYPPADMLCYISHQLVHNKIKCSRHFSGISNFLLPLVLVMDHHDMPNNFNSVFCCVCEITRVEKSGKESLQNRISEPAWSNWFRNLFDCYFARSWKWTYACFTS